MLGKVIKFSLALILLGLIGSAQAAVFEKPSSHKSHQSSQKHLHCLLNKHIHAMKPCPHLDPKSNLGNKQFIALDCGGKHSGIPASPQLSEPPIENTSFQWIIPPVEISGLPGTSIPHPSVPANLIDPPPKAV